MRKTFICIVGLCLLLGTAALFAQGGTGSTGSTGSSTGATTGTGSTTGTADTGTAKAKGEHKGGKGHKATSASGTVVSVEAACASFVVKPKKGDNWTFTTDATTTYWINKKPAECKDLKADQHVTVWYKADGDKKLATKVQIHEKKAKAGKTTG